MSLATPHQVVLITSRANVDEFGKKKLKDDLDTALWHMPVSVKEMVYAVALPRQKHTTQLILSSGVFVVNFLPYNMHDVAKKCDSLHGQHIDKFSALDVIKIDAQAIECSCIKEACGYLECSVQDIKEYEDMVLFIAKIIKSVHVYDVKRLVYQSKDVYTTTKD
ncbi:MAG: flavin reductase family protein [Candidatus Woesearchaeota archaeon]